MKRVKIFRDGKQIAGAEMENASQWLDQEIANNSWGLPERWVSGFNLTEEEKLQAIETRVGQGGLGEEVVEYKLAAEYEIIEEDITGEINAQIAKQERLQALKDKHAAMKPADLDTLVELRQAVLELQEILGIK
jgi:hypothetical protein